jgi:hypothetical protein
MRRPAPNFATTASARTAAGSPDFKNDPHISQIFAEAFPVLALICDNLCNLRMESIRWQD